MQKPNFSKIQLFDVDYKEQEQKEIEKELERSIDDLLFETNEQIKLKP